MKQFIQIALLSGHVFDLPIAPIAENRATYCFGLHPEEFKTIEEARADTMDMFAEDNWAIGDWAKNNMDVGQLVKDYGKLVRFTPPAADFSSAEWTFHDHPAMIAQPDPETVFQQPLLALVTAMAVHQNLCQLLNINGADGTPIAGVALFQGGPAIVGTYMGALIHLTNTVQESLAAPADVANTAQH